METQKTPNSQNSPEKDEAGGINLPDFRLHYEEYFHYFETKLSIPIKPLHQSQLEGCSHFEPLDVGRFQIYGHMLFLYGFHTQSASSSSSNRGRCDACITKSSQKVVYACMCVCMYA